MAVSVLVSADAEWRVVRACFPGIAVSVSPLGEWFAVEIGAPGQAVHFFHGGYGKIAAAALAQYVIDRWNPRVLRNLGTCGGFAGDVQRGTVILAERTIVYDIVERMNDPEAGIARYTTELDLSWLSPDHPQPVRRALLVSPIGIWPARRSRYSETGTAPSPEIGNRARSPGSPPGTGRAV